MEERSDLRASRWKFAGQADGRERGSKIKRVEEVSVQLGLGV